MIRPVRLALFAVAGPLLATVLLIGFGGLPAFGDAHELYGRIVNRVEPGLRHATNIVSAVNFDLRAFDTLGEEFILFAAVAGVTLLLRSLRDEHEPASALATEEHSFGETSDGVRLLSRLLLPLLVALGGYVVLHGVLTPGGGFQGGLILAAGPLVILFAGRYLRLKRVAPAGALESLDALGAAGYALIGLGGLVFVSIYLKNFLPLGMAGHLLSGGMMPLNSIAVGLEVAGAFLLTWTEFLDQALLVRSDGGAA